MPSVSVVVPHYYKERLPNLGVLIEALRAGTVVPDEIVVWNNDEPFDTPLDARVMQGAGNLGPQARFLAALMTQGDYILFQDNDLCVKPRTLENLLRLARGFPNRILTLDAYDIAPGASYASRRIMSCVKEPTRVNVSLGRMELVPRRVFLELVRDFPFGPETRMDDLWFSALAERHGIECWVVPTDADSAFVNLPTYGVGSCISDAERHYAEREVVYARLFPKRAA